MRLVGITQRGTEAVGGAQVATLSDDGSQVTVVASVQEVWADVAGHLAQPARGDTLQVPTSSWFRQYPRMHG